MAAAATTNIDQGIVLTYNNEVATLIRQNSGTVIYSKEDIIIASEISDSLYNSLLKSPYVQAITVLPLKRYTGQGATSTTTTTTTANQSGGTKTTGNSGTAGMSGLNQGGVGGNS